MRVPTPKAELYRWHERAIRGEKVAYHHTPECGFFVTRFVPRGSPIPASISMRQVIDPVTGELMEDETLEAEILGEPRDPDEVWMRTAKRPICRLYYLELLGKLM